MQKTQTIKDILANYESDNPGTKANLARILMHGKLGGTGKMVILPVDQGFEHGPTRSFGKNPAAYDPHYLIQLAIDGGLSAFAAPLGLIESVANTYAGSIPMILKLNSSNSLDAGAPNQAYTAGIQDALRLGCNAIGLTIYPGSENFSEMLEEASAMIAEAKDCGLPAVVWSYPRGGKLTKEGETALDVVAYAAHMAALMGAHIIKVKPPAAKIFQEAAVDIYKAVPMDSLASRIENVMDAAFGGKRLVIFSGGESRDVAELCKDVAAIRNGGGNGSIIGRNTFQRPRKEALEMLDEVINTYKKPKSK